VKAGLRPQPFAVLLARALAELERQRAIFEYPKRMFWTGAGARDLSLDLPGGRAASPLGPAAGPHTQMAQNIVAAWLAGARVIELKTVQVNDALEIPRPCIDAADVGYNVEWSQELPIETSAEQYAAAWLIVHALRSRGIGADPAPCVPVFDASVGYDLAGIRSDKVARFLDTMGDATALLSRLRDSLPQGLRSAVNLDAPPRIAHSVTLSTFHGCPPEEIEQIVEHLFERHAMHVVVKLNPTLLGFDAVEALLRGELGYDDVHLDREAFAQDLRWDAAIALFERLAGSAARAGLTLGAKLTNTLIVKNTRGVLEGEAAYLSGAPLHPIAVRLAARFAATTGGRIPLSFSAGVDDGNVADTVACGFAPVTSVTDLLKPNGYRRLPLQHKALVAAMEAAGADSIPGFILRRAGASAEHAAQIAADGERVRDAAFANLAAYADRVAGDPRYHAAAHRAAAPARPPLATFDCASCNKCVLVCPNGAFFELPFEPVELDTWDLTQEDGAVRQRPARFTIARERQWVLYADFCNACGNCDPFCPEAGGPFRVKPRVYGSRESFEAAAPEEGIWFDFESGTTLARFGGVLHTLSVSGAGSRFSDGALEVELDASHAVVATRVLAPAPGRVMSLSRYHAMRLLREAVGKTVNPVTAAGLVKGEREGAGRGA